MSKVSAPFFFIALAIALLIVGCARDTSPEAKPTPLPISTSAVGSPFPNPTPETVQGAGASPTLGGTPIDPAEAEELRWRLLTNDYSYWKTDFSKRSVSAFDISGGFLERDGIPPIYYPVFETPQNADMWLDPLEPVFVVEINDEVRAYPFKILILHEIVNDQVGGEPIAVTF